MIEKRFLKHVQQLGYFQEHSRVLVALSGGLDSMNLLQLLYQFRKELDIELAVAHINHKQRPESDSEEEELMKLAQELGVNFFASSFSGSFSEARARDFRYRFFEEIMLTHGYSALVTAHHADDQAETVLMRIIRGSHPAHLQGIADLQDFAGGQLIRPLLPFSKADFLPVQHYEDSSNQGGAFLRNRIRNSYLPELEQENPRLKSALVNLGKELGHWQSALRHLTKDMNPEDLQLFLAQPDSIQVVLLQQYLERFPDLQLSRSQFEDILQILRRKANYRHPLKKGYELIKDYQSFRIQKISRRSYLNDEAILLECGHLIQFGAYRFSFGQPLEGTGVESLAVRRDVPIRLRYRQEGDILLLNGHHKKVRRLFIDHKIPAKEREEAVLIEQNQQILAIANLAISDLSKQLKNDIMSTGLYIQKLDR